VSRTCPGGSTGTSRAPLRQTLAVTPRRAGPSYGLPGQVLSPVARQIYVNRGASSSCRRGVSSGCRLTRSAREARAGSADERSGGAQRRAERHARRERLLARDPAWPPDALRSALCVRDRRPMAETPAAARGVYAGRAEPDRPISQVCAFSRKLQSAGSSRAPLASASGGRRLAIGLRSPCTSSNRLRWRWPYPWRQNATNLIFCFAGPEECWRLGACFPSEHSRLQCPLHKEAFPRRALRASRQSQWDLIPLRGGELTTSP
jgi:hypothetical protein